MTIQEWLQKATQELQQAGINSARLDAELILAHTIRRPRTHLHANSHLPLNSRQEDIANARLQLRLERTPIAYIIGHKEFYGRKFKTTPAALIPRPESETIIELLKGLIPANTSLLPKTVHLVDVGTGTGCLGITAKLEWPELDVTLTDISRHALSLAEENAKNLHADVQLLKNNLLHGYTLPIDIIVANLPYIDKSWDVSPETRTEPQEALFADAGGLALIKKLLSQATALLKPGGTIILESDNRQINDVIAFAESIGYKNTATSGLITVFDLT